MPLWRRLVIDAALDMSLLPEWLECSARARDLLDRVRVSVARREGEVVGLVPFLELQTEHYGLRARVRELQGSTVMGYHSGFIARAHHAELIAEAMSAQPLPCDIFVVPNLAPGGASATELAQFVHKRGLRAITYAGERSPYLPIDTTWDRFLAARSSSFRYTLQRKEKALRKRGQLVEREYTTVEDVPALLEAILAVEAGSWKVEAGMAVSDSMMERRYYEALLPWLAREGVLCANALHIDGSAVAYSLCYRWLGRVAQAKTSFDERYQECSPGLVVNHYAIRRAFQSGASEFDFLGDVMPHKTQWTELTRDHETVFVFCGTWRGRLLGLAKTAARRSGRRERERTVGRSGQRAPQAAKSS